MSGYDVFEMFEGGTVLWYKAASDLAEATKLAQEWAAKTKNSFFILNQKTQTKMFVDATWIQPSPKSSVLVWDSQSL
jgi:hypothetical protein